MISVSVGCAAGGRLLSSGLISSPDSSDPESGLAMNKLGGRRVLFCARGPIIVPTGGWRAGVESSFSGSRRSSRLRGPFDEL